MSHRTARPDDVRAFLDELRRCTRIAVDTEFHAERRYLPQLHLVQIQVDGGRTWLFDANDALRRRTKNTADLRSVAFTALLGGSIYQMVRGDFLPAGGTMLMQAIDVLLGMTRRHD